MYIYGTGIQTHVFVMYIYGTNQTSVVLRIAVETIVKPLHLFTYCYGNQYQTIGVKRIAMETNAKHMLF